MPRLTAGEIAPGIASKKEEKRAVVLAIIQTLDAGISDRGSIGKPALAAFGSYRKMSRWADDEKNISPLSENTLRKYINELYPGGLKSFDRNRKRLLASGDRKLVKKGSKESYVANSQKLAEENQILTNQIMQFSAQYLDLLEKTSDIAKAHQSLQNFLKSHKDIYPEASKGFSIVTKSGINDAD